MTSPVDGGTSEPGDTADPPDTGASLTGWAHALHGLTVRAGHWFGRGWGALAAALAALTGPSARVPAAGAARRSTAAAPVLLVAEDLGACDEGYARFVRALESLLGGRTTVILRVISRRDPGGRRSSLLPRALGMVRLVRRPRAGGTASGVLIYVPRGPLTRAALLRGRLLKSLSGGVPLALAVPGDGAGAFRMPAVPRVVAPDLVLVRTEGERNAARACGIAAEAIPPGPAGATAGRLLDRLDELRWDSLDAAAGRRAAVAARLRRAVVDRRDWPRRLLWRRRRGYVRRSAPAVAIEPVEAPGRPGPSPRPRLDRVGVIGVERGRGTLRAVAELLGLSVQEAATRQANGVVDRALLERWPLFGISAASLAEVPEHSLESLAALVQRGASLYVDGLHEASAGSLGRLAARLGFVPPALGRAPASRRLLFPGHEAHFARELAGTAVETACGEHAIEVGEGGGVLAWSLHADRRRPAVVRLPVARGSVVLSVLGDTGSAGLADAFAGEQAGGALVAVLLLREAYGRAAWHAPAPLANFTIDDPALRPGLLGLSYGMLTAQARDHRFHVTVATVPRELTLAQESVTRRLRDQPDLLTACYHGCDHDGYEFYLTAAPRVRYRPRPLPDQREALRRAVEHGDRFARAHGCALDRVMVFPYGIGPAAIFPDLQRLGFVATCNHRDRYPLGAPVPADPDLGLRPADVAWEGFTLLWRRSLGDRGYLADLALGRPVLVFGHPRDLGADFGPFVERATAVNRATRGTAVWRGLEEVARHAYVQREDPAAGWQVLMTSSEACLHNPGGTERVYAVRRPHALGAGFEVDGLRRDAGQPLRVTVPPGGTAVVRLLAGGPPHRPRACSVFRSRRPSARR